VLMQPEYSDYNLGITKFISFTVTSDKSVTFDAISSQEFGASEPEMILYKDGVQIGRTTRNDAFGDLFRESLTAGDYVLAVFDHDNFLNTAGKGTICIDYTIGGSGDL